jgi:hypothetical protein
MNIIIQNARTAKVVLQESAVDQRKDPEVATLSL